MSKYDGLWKWIAENGQDQFKLTYAQIGELAGVSSLFSEGICNALWFQCD